MPVSKKEERFPKSCLFLRIYPVSAPSNPKVEPEDPSEKGDAFNKKVAPFAIDPEIRYKARNFHGPNSDSTCHRNEKSSMSTVRIELPMSKVLTCGPKFHKDNEFIIK